jgi:hypothetical protein
MEGSRTHGRGRGGSEGEWMMRKGQRERASSHNQEENIWQGEGWYKI